MVRVDHLQKQYKGFQLNVSLALPQGRITGIVGRNGAGKSTTIKSILGFVKPDAGNVTVFGKSAGALTAQDRQHMGVALAESGLSNYVTVKAAADFLARLYTQMDKRAFLQQAKRQGLPLDKPIKEFSTGMKAKLRVLAAMSHHADLLILDEPTAGLDVMARSEILDMLREYMAEDETRSILITSHISGDLENLCDDIYLIHNGNVVLHEETDVLLSNYALLKVTDDTYQKMDKTYLLKSKKTSFGYACLTAEKQYYVENVPGIVAEKGSIDELILMLAADEEGQV